jgi:hypothetical protein
LLGAESSEALGPEETELTKSHDFLTVHVWNSLSTVQVTDTLESSLDSIFFANCNSWTTPIVSKI